jgi:hypothetical protein
LSKKTVRVTRLPRKTEKAIIRTSDRKAECES